MLPARPLILFGSLAFAAAAPAQTITFAEGTPGNLAIVTVAENDPNGQATTVLQGVELLPIEITGRWLGQEHDAAHARRIDHNGMVRVELPGGARLLRYRRNGGTHFGFLLVAADGSPRVVLEAPAVGGGDPFEDRIGVNRNGSHIAVPLLLGGLWIVRLDGGVYASTGTPARLVAPTNIAEQKSVLVGDQTAWFQTESGQVLRCDLGDLAQPVDVSPPFVPNAVLEDQMAISGDGTRVVYLHGPNDTQLRIWTATSTSTGATVLPPTPSKYEEPGYLPEEPGSRRLYLNENGTRLFFVEALVRDESYLLDISGVRPTLHVTADAVFQPYIGVHILPRFHADRLTLAIGDPNRMDWFAAELAPAGGTVVNLTGTGSVVQPFPSGSIDPVSAVVANATAELAVEATTNGLAVRRIDLTTGTATLLAASGATMPQRAAAFAATADLVVPTSAGDRLFVGNSTFAAPLFVVPPVVTLGRPANGPTFASVPVALPGTNWSVPAYYLADGQFVLGQLEQDLVQICMTAQDGVVVVGPTLHYVSPFGGATINRPAVAWRRCLSGAGA
jgi:hypothetical protein